MEKPYKGRAIINDNITSLEIIIPVRRNWFVIIFIGAWLGGWFMGEMFAIGVLTGILSGNPADFFILFWLIAWTAGGFFAFKTFWWNVRGKEIIKFDTGQLVIDRKGSLFFKSKIYDLNEVKDIRAQEDINSYGGGFTRRTNSGAFNIGGTIRFDYGFQTIKFGAGLDEAEAKYILQVLKDKHYLKEKNLQPAGNN